MHRWRERLSAVLLLTTMTSCKLAEGFFGASSELQSTEGPERASYVFVEGATISTAETRRGAMVAEIQHQLQYATGALLERGVSADFGELLIEVEPEGEESVVHYSARFSVQWPTNTSAAPGTEWQFVVPKGGSEAARAAFFDVYGDACSSVARGEASLKTFWHHFRPGSDKCPLKSGDLDRNVATSIKSVIGSTRPFARGKGPEYDLLMKDKKLDVVIAFIGDGALSQVTAAEQAVSGRPGARVKVLGLTSAGEGSARSKVVAELRSAEVGIVIGDAPLPYILRAVNDAGKDRASYRLFFARGRGSFARPAHVPGGDVVVAATQGGALDASHALAVLDALVSRRGSHDLVHAIGPEGRAAYYGDADNRWPAPQDE